MDFFKIRAANRKGVSKVNFAIFILLTLVLQGCGDSGNKKPTTFKTDLDLPESLTGPKASSVISKSSQEKIMARGVENFSNTSMQEKGEELFQCQYLGPEDDDIFKNGYNMTKFMTSAVATWSCIGDSLIYISSVLPHDDKVRETEHDGSALDYDPEEPSHYKISDGEDGKVEVALYYGYSHSEPLPNDAIIGFYFSWQEQGDRTIGRMIIDALELDNPNDKPEDPIKVRMDFDYDKAQKKADMYMVFDENNLWADGFRIQVTKDLTADSDEHVFTAIGKISMTDQFLFEDLSVIEDIPVFDVFTVSDASGSGAAIAEFTDLGIPIEINASNHLGEYLTNKVDIYFFDKDSNSEYIDKSFQGSLLKGARNLIISLNDIEDFLGLSPTYFDNDCDAVDENCDTLLDAIFEAGGYGQEGNQGIDPEDWRSLEIDNAVYLDSVFPEGSENWDGVFDQTF